MCRGAAWSRSPLTFYYVLPGKAPLGLRSEKQATARVMSQAVLGKMFMMQIPGKEKWVGIAACGLTAPRDRTGRREQAQATPRGGRAVGVEASVFQFALLFGLDFFKFKKESYV